MLGGNEIYLDQKSGDNPEKIGPSFTEKYVTLELIFFLASGNPFPNMATKGPGTFK